MICLEKHSSSCKKFIRPKQQLQLMDESVKMHPAWRGTLSMLEGELILAGSSSFTYILTQGLDKYHYVLQYVGVDMKVYYKNVRLQYDQGFPVYRNGSCSTYKSINNLIPNCLKCSAEMCKPLV